MAHQNNQPDMIKKGRKLHGLKISEKRGQTLEGEIKESVKRGQISVFVRFGDGGPDCKIVIVSHVQVLGRKARSPLVQTHSFVVGQFQ